MKPEGNGKLSKRDGDRLGFPVFPCDWINPETQEKYREEYIETTSKSNIQDFEYEKQILKIQHLNGKMFEYIGVPRNTYIKMVNADSPSRFARRHIYGNFVYRKAGEAMVD